MSVKDWWGKLSEDERAVWVLKWQVVSAKRRFEDIQYIERPVTSCEEIWDEVDGYKNWAMFKDEGIRKGVALITLEAEWTGLIQASQHHCLYARGEWLLSVFRGLE